MLKHKNRYMNSVSILKSNNRKSFNYKDKINVYVVIFKNGYIIYKKGQMTDKKRNH